MSDLHDLTQFPSDDLARLAVIEPKLYADLWYRIDQKAAAEEKARCEDRLLHFCERAWSIVDPSIWEPNWHHEVLCEQLELLAIGQTRDLIANLPPRPVAEDQMILTKSRGIVPLREIIVGDEVLTHRRRWRRVTAVHLQGDLECLRIRTRRGRDLDLAPDHPVLTPDGWREAWTLRPDDIIGVVPGKPAGREDSATSAEARLLGYLIGDGHCSGTPNVTAKSDAVARDVKRCAQEIGFIPKEQSYEYKTRKVSITKGDGAKEVGTYTRIALNAQQSGAGRAGRPRNSKGHRGPVRAWLAAHDLDGKNSYTKRVPEAIKRGSDDLVADFLGAYWSCDGYISTKGAKRDGTERDDLVIGCCSVSRELMADIQQLLTRLGIISILRRKSQRIKTAKQGDVYVSYTLDIADQDNVARFAKTIKLAHEKDDRIRKARRRRFDFDREIYGEVIDEIGSIGRKACRCLTVEGDKSFTANGVAVHNTGKSLIISVLFPAWLWIQKPDMRYPLLGPQVTFLCISYGTILAEALATRARRLVMGDWYQKHWGDRVVIRVDQAAKSDFGNTAGGERISNSIQGGILGRGGAIQLIDDPHKLDGVESKLDRDRTLRAMREGLSTRITDPRISARVLTMQRLHEADATNYALDNWRRDRVHLVLPMRFERDYASPYDERQRDGELLWPTVWTEESVVQREIELAEYGTAGQLQQRPTPRSGGIITPDDWRTWPEWPPRIGDFLQGPEGAAPFIPLPQVSHVMLSLDTAVSELETADWNACVVLGVWHRPRHLTQIVGQEDNIDDGEQPRVIMMGAWRMRCKLNDETLARDGTPRGLVQRVIATARRFGADRVLVEDKTRGRDVVNEIERQLADTPFQLQLFNPQRHGDKVARLQAIQPLFSQGLVYAPNNHRLRTDAAGCEYVDTHEFEWAGSVMREVSSVPKGENDDFADALAQGVITLRDEGYLALTREYIANEMRRRMHRGRRATVKDGYGV